MNGGALNGVYGDASSPSNALLPAPHTPSVAGGHTILTASQAHEDEEEGGIDLRRLWLLMRRRRKVLALTFLSVLLLTALYTFLQKPIYQAMAQIVVSTPSVANAGDASGVLEEAVGATSSSRAASIGTQIALLQSQPVWSGSLKRLPPDARQEALRFAQPDIRPVPNSEVITIAVNTRKPEVAALLANAVSAEYIAQNKNQNSEQVRAATRFVQSQLQPAKARLDAAALALKKYQQENGTIDVAEESTARIAQQSALLTQQRDAEQQLAATRAQIAQLQSQIAARPVREETSTTYAASQTVAALNAQLTDLLSRRVAQRREYTEESRQIRDLDAQIADVRARLAKEQKSSVSSSTQGLDAIRQTLSQNLSNAQAEVKSLEARVRQLQATRAKASSELGELPERAYRLSQLKLDQDVLGQAYRTLNEKYQNLRISEEASLANVRVISSAEVPRSPISPRPKFNFLLAIFLGSLLSLAVAGAVERLDDRVHSDEDVEDVTGLTVLAHVPFIRDIGQQSLLPLPAGVGAALPAAKNAKGRGKQREAHQEQRGALLEAYRMLRSSIAFAGLDEPIRSVVVTSSQPGEGKSVSSVNLATAIAMSGKSVIVVDCDLRRPKLHTLFGINNRFGFTSVAAGQKTLEQALRETPIPNLRVLTSGPMPPNPPELLDSRTGRSVLRQAVEAADFVVFDTPPSLVMTDAQIVATQADGVLLVVSAAEAGKREIERTILSMKRTGARPLGVVLNKITVEDSGGYGYYGYKSYGEYLSGNTAALDDAAEDAPVSPTQMASHLVESTSQAAQNAASNDGSDAR